MIKSFYFYTVALSATVMVNAGPLVSKTYISANNIHVEDANLFVDICGNTYPVKALHIDSKGFYVNNDDSAFMWVCVNGHPNPIWNLVCAVCGSSDSIAE